MKGSRTLRGAVAVAFLAIGALMAKEIAAIGLAEAAVDAGLASYAHQFRPANARAAALLAEQQFRANEGAAAERLAVAAIAASPIEVVAVRTLGQAREARARGDGRELMLLAARLGWRDRPTQLWLIEQALLAGEIEVALQRAEAMVRLQRDRELVFSMLRLLAMSPDNRRGLVRSLAANPFWRDKFLSPDEKTSYPQLVAMARLLEDLNRTASPPTLRDARFTIDGLVETGHFNEAGRLHALLFPQPGPNLAFDGAFERGGSDYRPGSAASSFDWLIFDADLSTAAIEREVGRDNRLLYAVAEGVTGGRLTQQNRALPPGSYSFSYRMRSDDRAAPQRLRWIVRCATGGAPLLEMSAAPLRSAGWERRAGRFTVPRGCEGQVLDLSAYPEAGGRPSVAYFDDVVLSRVG